MSKHQIVQHLLRDKKFIPTKTKATAFAPSNIALCKYWGKRDHQLNLPLTSSLSISLGNLGAKTTISILEKANEDRIYVNNKREANESDFFQKCCLYLDLFRPNQGVKYQIETVSTVPIGAGLASSACGFAALIKALDDFYGWDCDAKVLSQLARMGSGSASRSIWHGFVEWQCGIMPDGSDSHGIPLSIQWPELCIGLFIVNQQQKRFSSRFAMKLTEETSPFYSQWPNIVTRDLARIKEAILNQDFDQLGEAAESNALKMHALMMSTEPTIIYSEAATMACIHKIHQLRKEGLSIYFTQDAGPNLKLLFLEKDKSLILKNFPEISCIQPFGVDVVQIQTAIH